MDTKTLSPIPSWVFRYRHPRQSLLALNLNSTLSTTHSTIMRSGPRTCSLFQCHSMRSPQHHLHDTPSLLGHLVSRRLLHPCRPTHLEPHCRELQTGHDKSVHYKVGHQYPDTRLPTRLIVATLTHYPLSQSLPHRHHQRPPL